MITRDSELHLQEAEAAHNCGKGFVSIARFDDFERKLGIYRTREKDAIAHLNVTDGKPVADAEKKIVVGPP